jgi:hypothetical protein
MYPQCGQIASSSFHFFPHPGQVPVSNGAPAGVFEPSFVCEPGSIIPVPPQFLQFSVPFGFGM